MIPKVIHYVWMGGRPLPPEAIRCMDSWKRHCPGYQIKEWNESNFNLDLNPYVREAYDNRKFAFVSDVVRLYALYTEGGIYMDTDVEVLKPLDRFLSHTAFSGFENSDKVPTGIMASEKGGAWAKENLDYYNDRHFILPDGSHDTKTNVITITDIMVKHGLLRNNTYQDFPGFITFYPKEFFCPKSYKDNKVYLTENTYTIHHFNGSWKPWYEKMEKKFWNALGLKDKYILHNLFGNK